MKFAREFKAALQSGDYPEEWCKAAIPYPTLKKCLNKIRAEFQAMGLDADTLRQLLAAQAVSTRGDQIPLAKYKFDVSDSAVQTHFTIFVDLEDGVVVDASLSPASKAFLEKQADIRRSSVADDQLTGESSLDGGSPMPDAIVDESDDESGPSSSLSSPPGERVGSSGTGGARQKSFQRVEVSLTADSEFFGLIYRDMAQLERIGQAEQAAITAEVVALGQEVSAVARPERKKRTWFGSSSAKASANQTTTAVAHHKYASDLTLWRELLELYLDAQVFFSTRERDHGKARTSAQASRQLDWFQEQVKSRGLLQHFQLAASLATYQHFLMLNKRLYLNLRFRELNQTAQSKILKKFDKWTALDVSRTFPDATRHHHDMLVDSLARDVCARIAEDVVAVVPRLEDYTCPVCLSIAWMPVRLLCRHVFCVRCVIKMQREEQKFCPLCRGEVVMQADLDNLDADLHRFLKLYFRQEVKEKQQANEIERGQELFGEGYKPTSCILM
ncbi:ring-14 protein [Sporothrix schenckii 1099-18]|uniref:RING-type domain-containing protein n=2 Tax=Sporothrix schenckii TaxID=29908 RepID=U7Q7K7_SPOS1|nr:ring-14 protein [Sporothrix schenckii 1099-18]ERT02721.1 hypothetical protein HMPREF1624_01022 [Sporothrix schenckii ATCC 58251]KJR79964.1 ring-14 protein [Sporothrix schenckii 1099-18]